MSNILMLDAELVDKLQADHLAMKTERDDLRGQVDRVTADAVGFSRQCTELRAQLAFARSVLEDCRPLVKGRLLSLDGRDLSVLERIEAVLEIK